MVMKNPVMIGCNFRDKKLNVVLKDWKKSGFKLDFKPRYETEEIFIPGRVKNKKNKPHFRKVKKRYFDVYAMR